METMNSQNMLPELPLVPSIWKRLGAFILDILCMLLLWVFILFLAALLVRIFKIEFLGELFIDIFQNQDSSIEPRIYSYAWILSIFIYSVGTHLLFKNTIGSNICRIQVIHISGLNMSIWFFLIRNLFLFLLFTQPVLSIIYGGIMFVGIFLNKNHRAIHDYLFNTIVVNKNSNYQEVLGKVNQ
jgi:uncharacterized RDD family membrane protein YckC